MPSDTTSLPRLSDEEFESVAAYAATDDSALLEQEARRARVAEERLREYLESIRTLLQNSERDPTLKGSAWLGRALVACDHAIEG